MYLNPTDKHIIFYNEWTGRLEELDDEEIADYEAGNDRADDAFPF